MKKALIINMIVISSLFIQLSFLFAQENLSNKQGIKISAICGKGCVDYLEGLDVYILKEKEYQQQAKNSELKSAGKTPLTLNEMETGIYVIAVDAILDFEIFPKTGAYSMYPDYEKYFIDDHPYAEQLLCQVESHEGEIENTWILRKWYKIEIEENLTSFLVVLYLNKDESLKEWETYYPKEELYHIRNITTKEDQQKFWDEEAKLLPELFVPLGPIDPNKGDRIFSLLRKGGKVCITGADSSFDVIMSVNSEGKITISHATTATKLKD